jgi:hypothetical protein
MKFHFLRPTNTDLVFLFLASSEYGKLLPWSVAPVGAMAVPYVEAWYPRDLPISAIAGALAVTVEPDDADSGFRSALRSVKDPELLSAGYELEGRTIEELMERVEEWTRAALNNGLTVEGADTARIEKTASAYRINVRVTREGAF